MQPNLWTYTQKFCQILSYNHCDWGCPKYFPLMCFATRMIKNCFVFNLTVFVLGEAGWHQANHQAVKLAPHTCEKGHSELSASVSSDCQCSAQPFITVHCTSGLGLLAAVAAEWTQWSGWTGMGTLSSCSHRLSSPRYKLWAFPTAATRFQGLPC